MKISIITVCYNSEKYLEQAILSVLNQNWPELEYIIIDGGSTDSTVSIIKKYETKLACWISEPDRGISHAFNKGLQKTTGDWIGILNSDDYYENNAFQNLTPILSNCREDIVIGRMNFVSFEQNQLIKQAKPFFDPLKPDTFLFPHPSAFVRRSCYEKIGPYNESYRLAMDTDFFLRCIKQNILPRFLEYPLTNQRTGGRSNFHRVRSLLEKFRSLHENGFHSIPIYSRMTWEIIFSSVKIAGSRLKKMLGLSQGPDLKNY
ncbi:MAG: glycosyltransferase [Candidatus Aureabacteria bacterium]|nr:glycosyltransferase [Candidatus Auribacterota bacterium]